MFRDSRLEPDLDDLFWCLTDLFHKRAARVQRQLEDNEDRQKRGQDEQDEVAVQHEAARELDRAWREGGHQETPKTEVLRLIEECLIEAGGSLETFALLERLRAKGAQFYPNDRSNVTRLGALLRWRPNKFRRVKVGPQKSHWELCDGKGGEMETSDIASDTVSDGSAQDPAVEDAA
jgi:hypothetical protein